MNHLAPAVPKLELAGNPARGSDRQPRPHPFMIGEEEHQLDVAGVVLEQLRVLWPDPRQGAGRREQRIESRGTHHAPLAAPGRPGKTDQPSALKNDKARAWEMDHDFADALINAPYGDVLG